jgi:hypothetical protein
MARPEFQFPIVAFQADDGYWIYRNWDTLTTANTTALRNGYFDHLLLVDSAGHAIEVDGATKLHGIGPFMGFNVFLQRRMRVEPKFKGELFDLSTDDVRKLVFKSWKQFPIAESADNFDELKASVARAASVGEIIALLAAGWP